MNLQLSNYSKYCYAFLPSTLQLRLHISKSVLAMLTVHFVYDIHKIVFPCIIFFTCVRDLSAAHMSGAKGLLGKSWPDLDMLPFGWVTDPGKNIR